MIVHDILQTFFTILNHIVSWVFPISSFNVKLVNFFILAFTYVPRLKTYIGYVLYFIPVVYLAPIVGVVIGLIVVRIVMALVRVVTDLL